MNRSLAAAAFAFCLLLPGLAGAACSNPAGNAGQQMYNTTYKVMQFCNGEHWISMADTGVSNDTLSSLACTSGQIIKWNGTAWQCATNDGGSGASQWITTGSDIYYNTGNVGIGTTSPAAALHVNDSTNPVAIFGDTGGGHMIRINDINTAEWEIGTGDYGLNFRNDYDDNGTYDTRVFISKEGNVGIGTTSPGHNLDITGTAHASGDMRSPIFYDSNNTGYYLNPDQGSNLNWLSLSNSSGNRAMTITQGGGQNFGSVLEVATNSSGNDGPRIAFHKHGQKYYSIGLGHGGNNHRLVFAEDGSAGGWGTERWRLDGHDASIIGTGPTRYWRDTDNNSIFALHYNSNILYFLSGWGSGWDGGWNNHVMEMHSDNSVRLRFIYDLDNTGYYLDLNNTSIFNHMYGAHRPGDCPGGWDCNLQAWDMSISSLYYTGLQQRSDARLKKNIVPLSETDTVEKLWKLHPVSYEWKDETAGLGPQFGLLAQDVETFWPELVLQADDEMGTKSISYTNLIAPMLQALQELKKQNDSLQSRIDNIQDQAASDGGQAVMPVLSDQEIDIADLPYAADISICRRPEIPSCLVESPARSNCLGAINAYAYEAKIYALCIRGDENAAERFADEYAAFVKEADQAGFSVSDASLDSVRQPHVVALKGMLGSVPPSVKPNVNEDAIGGRKGDADAPEGVEQSLGASSSPLAATSMGTSGSSITSPSERELDWFAAVVVLNALMTLILAGGLVYLARSLAKVANQR
jgi:hypothetical protein